MSTSSQQLMRVFEAWLAEIRTEILKNLNSTDVLDKEDVEKLVSLLNQRLVVQQHKFLHLVASASGSLSGEVEQSGLTAAESGVLPELAAGTIAAGGTAILANLITISTAGYLWTTTATAAATGATAIGVGVGLFTLGIGLAAGAAVGGGVYWWRLAERRKSVREQIMASFDNEAVPKLRAWAETVVQGLQEKIGGP